MQPNYLPQKQRQTDPALEELAVLKSLMPNMLEPMQVFQILAGIQQQEQRLQQEERQQQLKELLAPYDIANTQSLMRYHDAGTRHLDAQTSGNAAQQELMRSLFNKMNVTPKAKGKPGEVSPEEVDLLRELGIDPNAISGPPPVDHTPNLIQQLIDAITRSMYPPNAGEVKVNKNKPIYSPVPFGMGN